MIARLVVAAALVACGSAEPTRIDNGVEITYAPTKDPERTLDVIRKRLPHFGAAATARLDNGKVVVRVAEPRDLDAFAFAKELLAKPARLEVRAVLADLDHLEAPDRATFLKWAAGIPGDGVVAPQHVVPFEYGKQPFWTGYRVDAAAITPEMIAGAQYWVDPETRAPQIVVALTAAGRTAFTELTTRIQKKKIAIMLDGDVLNAPIVQEPITGGAFWIVAPGSGDDALAYAKRLVLLLKTGALPGPILEETVSLVKDGKLITPP